jgi:hypothetical protein
MKQLRLGAPAFVAQRIEHLTTDQKVGGSSPSKRTFSRPPIILGKNGQTYNFREAESEVK